MKTVTIYTDGGTAHRAGVRMSGRLAPLGQPASMDSRRRRRED